jgi:hypothetical protein
MQFRGKEVLMNPFINQPTVVPAIPPNLVSPPPFPAEYADPTVVEIGRAIDLVNSGHDGKRTDSYTGYYWNGEG